MYLSPSPRLMLFLLAFTLFSFGAVKNAMGQEAISLQPRLSYHQHYQPAELETSLHRNSLTTEATGRFHLTPQNLAVAPLQGGTLEPPAAGWLLLGGAAGSAVGVFGGAFLGGVINAGILQVQLLGFGIFTGAVIGSATMTPLGVHIANGRRGSYLRGLLVSAAAAVATIFIMSQVADGSEIYAAAGGAAVQIGMSTLIEHASSR